MKVYFHLLIILSGCDLKFQIFVLSSEIQKHAQ